MGPENERGTTNYARSIWDTIKLPITEAVERISRAMGFGPRGTGPTPLPLVDDPMSSVSGHVTAPTSFESNVGQSLMNKRK